jgi:mRNA-degrading endonuclease RelE of RelBE toxin-antitoxin system
MKHFKIIIEHSAFQDIQDSIDYYNRQQSGLGKKFHSFIKDAFEVLKFSPFFKVYKNNIRCMALIRFPFSVFFTVDEDKATVHIYAVLHQALDPDKINKRFE